MKNIRAIAAKDIKASFVTPVAYVVISGFILISGFFFFSLVQRFNSVLRQAALMPTMKPNLNEWVITPYYNTLTIVLIFLIPILSMGAIAEEKQKGTFELLATSPLSVSDIVVGKFFGIVFVAMAMLVISFVFPLVLLIFADPEVMPVIVGFIGVSLFAISFSAIALAASAATHSQIVAAVLSLVSLLLLFVIDAPAAKLDGSLAAFLVYFSPSDHVEKFIKGIVSGTDVVYFVSLVLVGLFATTRVIEAERLR
ncbi:MAG: ABC transporter permease [Deltaproteobacteria bacterium]|nr:ABC transporter permease [Deltaproteobacteria bacterium]